MDPGSTSPISKKAKVSDPASSSTDQLPSGSPAAVVSDVTGELPRASPADVVPATHQQTSFLISHMDYHPHLSKGGIILNPNDIHPMPVPTPRFDRDNYDGYRFLEDQGLPALGIALRDGVILAVNHLEPGSAYSDIIYEFDYPVVVSITGGVVSDCKPILETLKAEDSKWGFQKEWGIADPLAMVVDTLYCCPQVGLFAGWDFRSDNPALFRVDGMGTKIQGNLLAIGSGYRTAYSFMNLRNVILEMKHFARLGVPPTDGSFYFDILNDPAQFEKYSAWSAWSVEEAAKIARKGICWAAVHGIDGKDFASVYFVGRDGIKPIFQDIKVEEFLKECKMPLPLRRGVCAYSVGL